MKASASATSCWLRWTPEDEARERTIQVQYHRRDSQPVAERPAIKLLYWASRMAGSQPSRLIVIPLPPLGKPGNGPAGKFTAVVLYSASALEWPHALTVRAAITSSGANNAMRNRIFVPQLRLTATGRRNSLLPTEELSR